MSKIITDEQELNTAVGDLVTEDYALEILGLKSIADFRKFSRSFMKLSKIVKRIENSDNNKSEKGHSHDDRYYTEAEVNNELAKKLNKGAVSLEYDTAKKIEDKIKEIDEKFNDELNKKLDKSTVTSEYDNAAKIESKIKEAKKTADGKVSKSGDTMSGSLIVKDSQDPFTALYTRDMLVGGFARGYKVSIDGKSVAEFGVRGDSGVEEYVYIGSSWENVRLLLHSNGKSQLKANNLKTTNKEVVEAINELNNDKLNKGAVSSDYNTAKKIEDKIKTSLMYKGSLSGINSSQELFNLEPGIYTIGNGSIFDIGDNSWFTVIKYFDKYNGDQIVKVYYTASPGTFFLGAFNSSRWQGWKRYDSCPYNVGDIYITASAANPSTVWLGTAWQKQENRFLLGAGSSYGLGSTGGNADISLSVNNLPVHRHKVDSTSASISPHTHTFEIRMDADEGGGGPYYGTPGNGHYGAVKTSNPTSSAGGGSTGSFAPYTDYQGKGLAFSIMPPYLAVNIWKRIG